MRLTAQLFVVAPVTRWLADRKRNFNKRRPYVGVLLALAVLCLVSAAEVDLSPNLYHSLGIERKSSKAMVQSAYRQLSKTWHPDRNPDPQAETIFRQISRASEVLSSAEKRATYHRFGDIFNTDTRKDFKELLMGGGLEEVTWQIVLRAVFHIGISFVLEAVYGIKDKSSRDPFRAYRICVAMLDILLRLGPQADNLFAAVPFLNRFLPFEQIEIIQALNPIFLNIGSVFSAAFPRSKLTRGDMQISVPFQLLRENLSLYKRIDLQTRYLEDVGPETKLQLMNQFQEEADFAHLPPGIERKRLKELLSLSDVPVEQYEQRLRETEELWRGSQLPSLASVLLVASFVLQWI